MTTITPEIIALVRQNVGPCPDDFELPLPAVGLSVEEEREVRKRELAVAFRLFGRFGFSEGVAGHITARDPENPDWYWLNPFGMSFNQIKVSDLVCVDHRGHLVHGKRPVNAAAFCIHSAVHQARPDVVAAAHAHSVHGKAFASLGIRLDPITQDACAFYEDHGLYEGFGGVASNEQEGKEIAAAVGPHKAAILQNHGLITVGGSVASAAWWFITMDRSCQAQLLAMAAGTPKHIDHGTAVQTHEQIGTDLAGWGQFRPLWDQIVATQPDVFE
ncbi:Class II aldolase/adducin family protein [Nostocoides japonicum T1-X7]|uniref:Class II aldolase/adducin family protein n=1 Tax=Nostocoides japonicum T1-X7 TaxID=1194083 RepID=A0A077M2V1_9MICO|nr:class II aldolase/adducin family protein [Tetrasphaera japonica]CCH79422.1 Class II aldolase/adducin family protein [Tetrasphaera japonica T1-X7]